MGDGGPPSGEGVGGRTAIFRGSVPEPSPIRVLVKTRSAREVLPVACMLEDHVAIVTDVRDAAQVEWVRPAQGPEGRARALRPPARGLGRTTPPRCRSAARPARRPGTRRA